jgi:2-methylcitrate dehydratase PrpD
MTRESDAGRPETGVSEFDVTRALAAFAVGIGHDALPVEVSARARTLILDTVGIALRARHDAQSTPSMLAALSALGYRQGAARVIGDPDGWTAPGAALINGALAHSLDFDDTHAAGSIHPSAPIVPAALAAAEMSGASGADTVAAIVAGYEIQIRLSIAMNPSEHYARGYHPTATCGAFGAAAAAGRLLGLDVDGMVSAFGLALSQAAGSISFLDEGAWSKPFQVGWAAHNGLVAARLAAEGFQGPKRGIDGPHGFLHAYAPEPDYAAAAADLGSRWETLAIAVKPFPSCRYSHAPMNAVAELVAANDIAEDEIQAIRIGLPKTGMRLVADPHEVKIRPSSIVEGQFSMPFLSAVTARSGTLRWDDYRAHLTDEKTRALTQKVRCAVDERCEAAFPANMAGVAVIETARGTFESFVEVPKGEPGNWPTDAEHRAKFDGLVGPYLDPQRREALASALLSLHEEASIPHVLDMTRPTGADLKAAGED